MTETGHRNNFRIFLFIAGALCMFYALVFRPVTYEAQGDFPAYLDLARQIFHLPGATDTDLGHRSPLYSIILGLFLMVFGEPHYLEALMVFQYALIFASSLLVYKIIQQLTGSAAPAFIAGIAGIASLTTIFFGFMILSETLAMFLFTLTVWLLLKYMEEPRTGRGRIAVAGLVMGLLILTRYNMLGLPFVILALLIFTYLLGGKKPKRARMLADIALFSVAITLILNIWAFRNYLTTGRYELIPKHHMGQRWAVPATINPSDRVSDEFIAVHEIFLRTREDLLEKERNRVYRKSTLLEYDLIRKINDGFRPPVSGYLLYRDSEEALLRHYQLERSPDGIRQLSVRLAPFYEEIAVQHKEEIRRFRTYSFLYSFKHISPTLPGGDRFNLNRLPSPVLKAYKVMFILIMVLTFAGSIVHMIHMVFRVERLRQGLQWIMVYGLIWYFPVINWYANVLGDANRFRYPADMIIIGLFVSYCWYLYGRARRNNHGNERVTAQA